ncbi:MAG: hypothetical protein ACYDD1_19105 [Caulobacteraceae bacterium]
MCVSHDGAAAPALAAADAAGWMTLDSSMVPMPTNGAFAFKSFQVRMKPEAGHVQMLLAGEGTTQSGGAAMAMHLCMVLSQPGDPTASDAAKAWLGMAPLVTSPQISVYIFGAGAATPLRLTKDTLQPFLKAGTARVVMIPNISDKASMLIYATPIPTV